MSSHLCDKLKLENFRTKSQNLISKSFKPHLEKNEIFTTNIPRVTRTINHSRKRRKYQEDNPLIPITFAYIFKAKATRKHRKTTPIKVLIDSGASSSIIYKDKILDNKVYQGKTTEWDTTAGRCSTTGK